MVSIGAELKSRYGAEPEMTYETGTGDHILGISFGDYRLPGGVTAEGHAREIAAFAVGKTAKREQIDAVEVRFLTPSRQGILEAAGSPEPYRFALDDLMPARSDTSPN